MFRVPLTRATGTGHTPQGCLLEGRGFEWDSQECSVQAYTAYLALLPSFISTLKSIRKLAEDEHLSSPLNPKMLTSPGAHLRRRGPGSEEGAQGQRPQGVKAQL